MLQKLNISSERLQIRNLINKDLYDFHFYRSNPEVTKYQGFDVFSVDQAAQFLLSQQDKLFGKAGEWVQYGIVLKETGKIIGDCAIKLQKVDPRIAEIGITISHIYQQQGFGKEALLAIISFLFDNIKIHRIVETVDAENIASINLLKSIGFRQEGHFIENIFFKGKWGSEYQYALLRREWEGLKKIID